MHDSTMPVHHDQPPRQMERRSSTFFAPASPNVGEAERLLSTLAGGALVAYGLRQEQSRVPLTLAGGYLLYRGVTGYCPLYRALNIRTANTDSIDGSQMIRVERVMTINAKPDEIYTFWRNFENLPRFMRHLESVQVYGDRYSHWVAHAPAGTTVEWDAELISDRPNELIAWRSLPTADVQNGGSVRFRPAPGDRGTEVHVVLAYQPPGGQLGRVVAKLFGEEPAQQVHDDLHRLKMMVEAGEIATNALQVGYPEAER